MKTEQIVAEIVKAGAFKAAPIEQESYVLDRSFRDICASNGCGTYDKCWTCPPCIGDIDELIARVNTFPHGVLYQTVGEIEDSYDFEGMMEVGEKHARLGQEIQAKVVAKIPGRTLHLSCGGCHLCPECAKRVDEPCRHPDLALAPMEGYGFDVYNTAKATPLKYVNGTNTVTYFGIVLFDSAE